MTQFPAIRYPELIALAYIGNMWGITSMLFAGRTSELMRAAAYAHLMMLQELLGEYYERPQAQILTFVRRA